MVHTHSLCGAGDRTQGFTHARQTLYVVVYQADSGCVVGLIVSAGSIKWVFLLGFQE